MIRKHANQGAYVDTGTSIYTVADLRHLWVRLEAYESDMEWLHLGQEVDFTTEALPGGPMERGGCVVRVVDGPDQGTNRDLPRGALVVGTSADCDLTLTDTAVSGRHLQIQVTPAGLEVRDLVGGEPPEVLQLDDSGGSLVDLG